MRLLSIASILIKFFKEHILILHLNFYPSNLYIIYEHYKVTSQSHTAYSHIPEHRYGSSASQLKLLATSTQAGPAAEPSTPVYRDVGFRASML
jgi:hypothetical protein